MKEISVVYSSGHGHTTPQAKGIVSGLDGIRNVSARAFGTAVATTVRDSLR